MSEQSRVALVTGASRGIGKAIAQALAAVGCTVVGTATTDSGAQGITEYLQEAGNPGRGMTLNVGDEDSVATVIKGITEEFGAPTLLVNNAGITRDNILMRMKQDEWDDVIDTNLSALYRVSKACLRGMTKARWGRIVNITSVVGSMGNIGQSNYAATKAGAEGFSRALARELGSRSVTVNCGAPGFIDTDMTRELTEEQRDLMLGQIPLGRLGQPEEIAALVAFKREGRAAKGRDRLLTVLPHAEAFFVKMLEREVPLAQATAQLTRLLDDYGAVQTSAALESALRHDTPSLASVALWLEQERRKRHPMPRVPLDLPDRPGVRSLHVTPHSLETYDALTKAPDDEQER